MGAHLGDAVRCGEDDGGMRRLRMKAALERCEVELGVHDMRVRLQLAHHLVHEARLLLRLLLGLQIAQRSHLGLAVGGEARFGDLDEDATDLRARQAGCDQAGCNQAGCDQAGREAWAESGGLGGGRRLGRRQRCVVRAFMPR